MQMLAYDTDEQLMQGIYCGKENAFTIFYHRYYPRVLYFSRRYVSEADAQDIASEAFLQLWRKKNNFPQLSNAINFLFITARNRCYDLLRHRQVHEAHAAELTLLMKQETGDFFTDQVRVELVNILYTQLAQLPPKTREVFMLSFQEGLKPAQIAEQLGVSVKTVKNQKLTAVKLLRSALAEHPLEMLLLLLYQFENNFGRA